MTAEIEGAPAPAIFFDVRARYFPMFGKPKVVRFVTVRKRGRVPRQSFYPFKAVMEPLFKAPRKRYLKFLNKWEDLLFQKPNQLLLTALKNEGMAYWKKNVNAHFKRRITYSSREDLRKGKMGYARRSTKYPGKMVKLRRSYRLRNRTYITIHEKTVKTRFKFHKSGYIRFNTDLVTHRGYNYTKVLAKGCRGYRNYLYVPEIDRKVKLKRSRKLRGRYKPTQWKEWEKELRTHLNKWAMANIERIVRAAQIQAMRSSGS